MAPELYCAASWLALTWPAPPALPGINGTVTLSDFRVGRHPTTTLEMRSPPAPDLPQLLRSPSLHAVPSTPVDRTGACRFLLCPRGLPRLTGGSASTTFTFEACSGFTRVTACKVAARPTADSCPEASTRPVTRPDRSVATMSYRQLHRWILLPPVICAIGAHR